MVNQGLFKVGAGILRQAQDERIVLFFRSS